LLDHGFCDVESRIDFDFVQGKRAKGKVEQKEEKEEEELKEENGPSTWSV